MRQRARDFTTRKMDEINEELFVDKNFLIELQNIQWKTNLVAEDFDSYLQFLTVLQKSEQSESFIRKCIQEMMIIKEKLYGQSLSIAYRRAFPKVTRIFGSFLLQTDCKSQLFTDIIETWFELILPHKPIEIHEAIVQNEDIFNKLFTKLRSLGHFLKQWDLIQLLLQYTMYDKALSSDDLLFIAKGPAFTHVRDSLQKMTTKNYDKHCIDILHRINVDSPGDKFVVAMPAIEGRFDNDTAINTFKMDGVPQQLMVYFNLGKPGISCLCDPSTFDKNDNSETIHGYDIDMENIKKITFSEMPSLEIFQIKIRFLYRDPYGKKKLIFNFDINLKDALMNSAALEVLKIGRSNLSITTASTNRSFSSYGQGGGGRNKTILAFETTSADESVDQIRLYVSDSDTVEHAQPQKIFYRKESNQNSIDSSFQLDSERDILIIDEPFSQFSSIRNSRLALSQNNVNKSDSQRRAAEDASKIVLSDANNATFNTRDEETPMTFPQIVDTVSSRCANVNPALLTVVNHPKKTGFQDSDRNIESYSQSSSKPNLRLALSQDNVIKTDSRQKITEDPCKFVLSQRISQKENSDSGTLDASPNTQPLVQSQQSPIRFLQMLNRPSSRCSSPPLPKVVTDPKTSGIQRTEDSVRLMGKNSASCISGKTATISNEDSDSDGHLEKPARYSQLVQNRAQQYTNSNPTQPKKPIKRLQVKKRSIKTANEATSSQKATTSKKAHRSVTDDIKRLAPPQFNDVQLAPSPNNDNVTWTANQPSDGDISVEYISTSILQKKDIVSNSLVIKPSNRRSSQRNTHGIKNPNRISQLVKNKELRSANANRTQPKVNVLTTTVIEHTNDPYSILDTSFLSEERIKPIKRLQNKKRSIPTAKKLINVTFKKEPAKKTTAIIKPNMQKPYAELTLLQARQPEFNDLLNYSYRRQAIYNNINKQLRTLTTIPEVNSSIAEANNESTKIRIENPPIANNTIPVAKNATTSINYCLSAPGTSHIKQPAPAQDENIAVSVQTTEPDDNSTPIIENIRIGSQIKSSRQCVSILRENNGPQAPLMARKRTASPMQSPNESMNKITKLNDPLNFLDATSHREIFSQQATPSTDSNDFVAGPSRPSSNRPAESGKYNPLPHRTEDQNHFQAKMLSESKKRSANIIDRLKAHDRELEDMIKSVSTVYAKMENDTGKLYEWALQSADSLAEQVQKNKQMKLDAAKMLQNVRDFLVTEPGDQFMQMNDAAKAESVQRFISRIK